MKYFAVLLGLLLGHLAFQYGAETPDYGMAMDRMYYQAVAVLVVWMLD